MPAPRVPSGLPADRVAAYNELYDMFGQKAADDYAAGFPGVTITPAPPPAVTPSQSITPPMMSVPPLQVVTSPSGRPTVVPITGTTPPSQPLPEMRYQLQDRPAIPEIRMTQDELASAAVTLRTSANQKRGMSYEDAQKEAREYVEKARRAPRTVEFGSPRGVPGYSELAVRGEELLPKMSGTEAAIESVMPQVLETEAEAEGRRRFEKAKADAKRQLEAESKAAGLSQKDYLDRVLVGNAVRAGQIAEQKARDEGRSEVLMKDVNDIKAQLDAPYYAAADELRGKPPNEVMSQWAADTLRGLTTEEKYGRLVETRGAAVLRNVGGVTRVGVRALGDYVVDPVVAGVVAATSPNVTYDDLQRMKEEEIAASGGARRVRAPGVTYEKGFEARNRIETGSFVKDVAYEVATGRSAIDDYIDAGAPVAAATVLGVVTELGLPGTPVGYVTDVLPAIKGVGAAAGLGRGAARLGAGALGTALGVPAGPVGMAIGGAAGTFLASETAGRALSKVMDVPEAIRLNRYIADQVKTAGDLGRVMDRPSFWKVWSDVTDARVNLASRIADDSADIAATRALIQAGDTARVANRIADIIEGNVVSGAATRKIAADLYENVTAGRLTEDELVAALRANDPSIAEEIATITKGIEAKVIDKASPDIVRNTYAKAVQAVKAYDADIDPVLAAALAETLEKVPTSKYMFVTPRMIVSKEVVASKDFQTAVSSAVKNLPSNATIDDVTRTVEDVIRAKYNGKSLARGDIKAGQVAAEPAAVRPPIDSEGFLVTRSRGGLERLATPAGRRPVVLETARDLRDTLRALVPSDRKLVSEAFARSTDMSAATRMIDNAVQQRIPTPMRDFLVATKSEIDALAVSKLERADPRILVPGAAGKTRGILIDAIRAQGDDGLNVYLNARIAADADNPLALKAARVTGSLQDVKPWAELPMEGKLAATESMTRKYFGDSISKLIEPEVNAIIKAAVKDAVEGGDSATDAVLLAVAGVRRDFPELAKAGRRSTYLSSGAKIPSRSDTLTRDDLVSAMFEHVIEQEAKVIFTENFYKSYPDLVLDTKTYTSNVKAAIYNRLDDLERSMPGSPKIAEARRIVDDFMKIDLNRKELAETAIRNANREMTSDMIAPVYRTGVYGPQFGPNTTQMIDAIVDLGDPSIIARVIGGLQQDVTEHVQALKGFLYQNRVIRPVTENDIITFISNDLYVPMTRSQKEIAETLIGPINDLTKGAGNVANNLEAIYRSTGGAWETLSLGIRSVMDTFRTTAAPGMTSGIILPNIKFHAVNYFSAPFIMAVTSPGAALNATLGELSRVIPIRSWQEANSRFIQSTARDATRANEVAFVSDNGIPYTYKQLDDYMNENYFGMTNETFQFGNKFGDDVRIELGLNHSGTPAKGLDVGKDKVSRYLNLSGPGQFIKVASSVDTAWRQNAFLAALKSGESVENARRLAKNAVLDYGRIPASLRQQAARYMTFFSWFAISNGELFGSLFRPAAMGAVAKQIRAQRELHRGFGDWQYADDSTKKKMFSVMIGNYDDLPAYFVGPENPWAGPLIDQVSLASGIAALATGQASPGQVAPTAAQAFVEKSFTPALGYLADIGVLGEKGAKGKTVPPRQIAFHRAMGDEHFAAWLSKNNVTTIPYEQRRLGEPTFFGQQYEFSSEEARKAAAFDDYMFTMLGVNRMLNDYMQMGLIAAPPQGADLKRYDKTGLGLLTYFVGGNLTRGTTPYEEAREALVKTNQELKKLGEE